MITDRQTHTQSACDPLCPFPYLSHTTHVQSLESAAKTQGPRVKFAPGLCKPTTLSWKVSVSTSRRPSGAVRPVFNTLSANVPPSDIRMPSSSPEFTERPDDHLKLWIRRQNKQHPVETRQGCHAR